MEQNDLQLLKQKIYEDEKIITLLEELDCTNIHTEQNGNLIVAQLPDRFNSNNKRSIQIKNNESLTAHIRSRDVSGDIYSIIGYILYDAKTFDELRDYLYQIKIWICNVLEYDNIVQNLDFDIVEETVDWNGWLRSLKKKRKQRYVEIYKNKVLPESILNQYIKFPHICFCKAGISPETQAEFEIAYDVYTNRITFPVRNKNGELVGVKGRYVGDNQNIEENYKYIYLYPCDKSVELFNLYRALPYIKEYNEVIVVEGAKSVMLLYEWGVKNAVSLEGKSMSPVQAKMLKDLDVDITFAFDKDVDAEFIKKNTSQIKSRNVYAIYDTKNLLIDHDSPVDKGFETWDKLYKLCKYKVN